MDTKLNISTAYHPQSDGQTEHANRTLEEMLRAYISYNQRDWDQLLPMMEFAYNYAKHASTGFSPFYLTTDILLYQKPSSTRPRPQRLPSTTLSSNKPLLWLKPRTGSAMLRTSKNFSAKHISLAAHNNRPSRKLEPKYIGSYTIIEEVHKNAFKLDLPPHMRQHPIFNADLLRPYHEPPTMFGHPTNDRPPPGLIDGTKEWEVEEIVDYKTVGKTKSPRWLIKWKGYPEDDSTWEPQSTLTNVKKMLADFETETQSKDLMFFFTGRMQTDIIKALPPPFQKFKSTLTARSHHNSNPQPNTATPSIALSTNPLSHCLILN
ncbi:hypothetical protein MVEG_11044 [Podila verticillata NRRL 6337]|uniref:Chromo domain-containing protein n=1 Tax=Podila verticillata NRRL 6337 TaxID=1069443 RepID=A0A086TM29_9FUNG|nr:hypothetical protein MVEG_11044 [Podila verticillata NRRL 6337]